MKTSDAADSTESPNSRLEHHKKKNIVLGTNFPIKRVYTLCFIFSLLLKNYFTAAKTIILSADRVNSLNLFNR